MLDQVYGLQWQDHQKLHCRPHLFVEDDDQKWLEVFHKIFGMKRPKNTISSIEPVAKDSPYVQKSMLARNLNIVEWTKLVLSEQLSLVSSTDVV